MMKIIQKKELPDFSTVIGLVAIIILFIGFSMLNSSFSQASNISNILTDISPLLLMAVGVTFIIILGSTDLSIGAVCSLTSVLFVRYAEEWGIMAYLLVGVVGLFSGLIIGILQAKFKVPSFIASLGMMSIWESFSLVFSDSGTIQLNPKFWYTINWLSMKLGIVPSVFLVAVAITLLFLFIQHRTRLGKYIFAIGANERAAWMVGVPVTKVKILCFGIAGICYALGGVMFVAKMVSGSPNVGDNYTLLSIAAVALGGTSMAGGKGSVVKTLTGVAVVMIVRNGMTVIGIDSFWQKIVYGTIIIIAAYLTADHANKEQIIK